MRTVEEETERAIFWERQAKKSQKDADYYQEELVKAHALLGRVIQQLSERWDSVNLTKYYPTSNLHRNMRPTEPIDKEPTL